VYNDMHCVKKFANTLDLKHEFDVTPWRHKQRIPIDNDHHTPLLISLCPQGCHLPWQKTFRTCTW